MKKPYIWLLFFVLCLVGCGAGSQKEATAFSISAETQKKYKQEIDTVLYNMYWRYDGTSFSFMQGTVPERTKENEAIFVEAEKLGLPMNANAGKSATVATVTLQHFNGETAGLLYSYFVRDRLVGIYYVGGYFDKICSLGERNLFLADGKFKTYETETEMPVFQEKKAVFPIEGFCDTGTDRQGNFLGAAIDENGRLALYRYRTSMTKYRNIAFEGGLVANSAAFLEMEDGGDGLAVLLSNTITEGTGEGESTYTRSEKVVFFNSFFSRMGESITLPNGYYSCVGYDDGVLYLMTNKTLECYTKGEEGWKIQRQYYLEHGATYMHITDLDGDGTKEYLMTDGFDLYLYQQRGNGFVKIWSTHLAIESILGGIYSGDLNRDGVKEVYVCDTTSTTMRYVLLEKGLMPRNKDIVYGQRIYAMDLDGDGKEEYIGRNSMEEPEEKVYFSEP